MNTVDVPLNPIVVERQACVHTGMSGKSTASTETHEAYLLPTITEPLMNRATAVSYIVGGNRLAEHSLVLATNYPGRNLSHRHRPWRRTVVDDRSSRSCIASHRLPRSSHGLDVVLLVEALRTRFDPIRSRPDVCPWPDSSDRCSAMASSSSQRRCRPLSD